MSVHVYLHGCVHVCFVCMCIWVSVLACRCVHRDHRLTWNIFFYCLTSNYFRKSLTLNLELTVSWLDRLRAKGPSRIHLSPAIPTLPVSAWVTHLPAHPAFYMSVGDLNSCLHACTHSAASSAHTLILKLGHSLVDAH